MAKAKKTEISEAEAMKVFNATNTEDPSESDRKALAVVLDDNNYLQKVNHSGRQVLMRAMKDLDPGSYMVQECTKRQIEDLRKEMGYTSSTMIEQLIIDEIVICWVRLQQVQSNHTAVLGSSHSSETGGYWDRRLTSANNRFLKSVQTLAKVRKLIGATQVHAAKMYKNIMKE